MVKKICLIVISFFGFWMMVSLLISAYVTIVYKVSFWNEATQGMLWSFFMMVLFSLILWSSSESNNKKR